MRFVNFAPEHAYPSYDLEKMRASTRFARSLTLSSACQALQSYVRYATLPMSRNTIARIDLAAIRHNFATSQKAGAASHVACVVKADAYGHGLNRVCAALSEAELLAVATVG